MRQYFDITDLIRFARTNRNVSGIQRVQIRVLKHMAADCAADEAICMFARGRLSGLRACRARDLFGKQDYDAETLLAKLGLENPAGAFTKRELKDYLAQFKKRSLKRAIRKAQLLALACISKQAARKRMGLAIDRGRRVGHPSRIETWPVSRIDPGDHLVMIGTNWNVSRIEAVAKRHSHRGGRVTQVVYDLIPVRHPEYCIESLARKFSRFLARSLQFTSQYVCISRATKRDLEDYLSARKRSTPVEEWPLAHEFEGYPRNDRDAMPDDPELLQDIDRPFVLCVGTIEIRKNGIALLRAWQKLRHDLGADTPLLVFAGKYGWKIDDFRELLAADLALARDVRIRSRPTDADLACLYQRCLFTAYPSLVEGWGLPVGEAAWFGKHSVVSTSSSLPEVCGDLVDYIDPLDTDTLTAAVKRAVLDDDYRSRKEQAIRGAMLRTWSDTARHFGRLVATHRATVRNVRG